MDISEYFRFLLALVFVLGLIGLIAVLLRQFGYGGAMRIGRRLRGVASRLKVVEIAPIDARRRLVLVRCDDREHLLLLGPEKDVVIEAGIPGTAASSAIEAEQEPGSTADSSKSRFNGLLAAVRGEERG